MEKSFLPVSNGFNRGLPLIDAPCYDPGMRRKKTGRPKLEIPKERIEVRLERPLLARVERLTREEGVSPQEWIAREIRKAVARRSK